MSTSVEGKCVCFTGTLQQQTRAQAAAAAKKAGATVAKSITGSVDIVVAGPGAGAKLEQAKKKGCEVWSEDQFLAAIGGEATGAAEAASTPSKKKKAPPAASPSPAKKKAKTTPTKTTPAKTKAATKVEPATPAVPGSKTRKVMSVVAGGNEVYSVVDDYDVKLMLSDQVSMNSNKFYKLQLLQKTEDDNYYVATNWGRLGEPGQSQLKGPHSDLDKAVKEFGKVFRSKTKNAWGADPFVRYPDKYQLIETTVDEDDDDDGTGQALGRLTESQIQKGQAVLKEIRETLDEKKKMTKAKRNDALGALSNEFYSLIPTTSGRQKPPKLDNLDIVTEKEGLLEFWLRMGFEEVSPQNVDGSPIDGLEQLPVPTTLRAAASSISDLGSINSSRTRGESLASKKAGNPVADSMGPELYAAILLYTGNSIYRELNRCLRLEWKSARKYWNYLRLYFAAMECMPRKKETLWRGIAADLYDEYEPGKIITWWTVSSCTSDKSVAQNFMSQLGGKATLLTLHTLKACDISALSFYPHERESLLSPGTKLKVLSRKRNGKVAEIEVEEVVDDDGDKKKPAEE
ncbi:polymerase 1 [Seminavis robusta]|uniref:NAD(P)(+)--arginine ADP-ribosyltransferase n=1 Tax=Seminavis robusta TaxID=568900 RepID=A0A9N8HTH5_9STRA|nr:polymerase 1 [Seminavis robusta]|eukprot:Sro1589_g284370.1 polymerase 1 (572) ;mRNA; r:18562-20277